MRSLVARCDLDLEKAKERIFANPGLKAWQEFRDAKEVPPMDLNNGETMFAVKTGLSGKRFVRSVEYGEDSAMYQGACFDSTGRLQFVHYELRTAWGWGYEEKRTFGTEGKLLKRSARFFDTRNNATINRPAQADEVPDFLTAKIYTTFESMPFISAFQQEKHASKN